MPLGGLVTLFVLLPKLLMVFFRPTRLSAAAGKKSSLAAGYEPCMGIPILLAISPVIYFLAASALFHSWYLLAAAVLLGIGHIYVSSLDWKRAKAPFDTVG